MQNQDIGKAVPFRTTNNGQAFALALCGYDCVIRNEYTPEQLRGIAKREKLERITAREAWEKGFAGTVSYTFAAVPGLYEVVAAFDEEAAKIKAGGDGTPMPNVNPTDLARIVAGAMIQRKPFADQWKRTVPFLTIPGEGEPMTRKETDGRICVTYPGFKSIRINASPEDLARLNA